MSKPVINFDVKMFLDSFDDFSRIYCRHINADRKEMGLASLTNDEMINLFIDLRKEHAIDSK